MARPPVEPIIEATRGLLDSGKMRMEMTVIVKA